MSSIPTMRFAMTTCCGRFLSAVKSAFHAAPEWTPLNCCRCLALVFESFLPAWYQFTTISLDKYLQYHFHIWFDGSPCVCLNSRFHSPRLNHGRLGVLSPDDSGIETQIDIEVDKGIIAAVETDGIGKEWCQTNRAVFP